MRKTQELASILTRALAFAFDVAVFMLLRQAIKLMNVPNITYNGNSELISSGILTIVVFLIYFCILPLPIYLNGRTLGKALFGIRIVALDGKPLTFARLSARNWAGYMLSSFMFMGFVWSLNNDMRQTWHDVVARTIVVTD